MSRVNAFNIRPNIRGAIAWTIIAEIVRHHGSESNLRVIKMFPGGGHSEILSLFRVRGPESSAYDKTAVCLGDFNLGSGKMTGYLPRGDSDVDWFDLWFLDPDPARVVEISLQTMGLDVVRKLPPTNRRIFGCRLLAGLLSQTAFRRDYLDAKMAFADTSGYGGGVSESLSSFTGLVPERDARRGEVDIASASDCWLLHSGWENKLVGAIRMDGYISSISDPTRAHDLFGEFRQGLSIIGVVGEAQRILAI